MYKLQVTADKLNIRSSPEADPTFANWVGDMNNGEIFTAIEKLKGKTVNGNDNWYVDNLNRYIAEAWVSDVTGIILTDFPWWIKNYGIDKIWNRTKGAGIKIAILDTGIDADHFALKSSIKKIVYAAFKSSSTNLQLQGDLNDNNGHGTECAGMITARDLNNNQNCTGVAPDSGIFMYKVFNDNVGDAPDFLVTGIAKALSDNVDIISISRNIDNTQDVIAQIQNAINKKVFVVVCGGNNSDGVNPLLNINGLIRIGAINNSGNDLTAGNISINAAAPGNLDFYAPGISIKTTNHIGGFTEDSGTSFATPFIAGLLALKLATVDRSNPSFYQIVLNDLQSSIETNSSNFKFINTSKFIK